MPERAYIFETLFFLLAIVLLITAFKFPKDVFVKLPLEILKLPLRLFSEAFFLGFFRDVFPMGKPRSKGKQIKPRSRKAI